MGKDSLEGPGLWQSTVVKRSIQILQQSSELQTGSIAQEAAKACCLDSLSSDRKRKKDRERGCTVSIALFSVQQIAVAHTILKRPVHKLCKIKWPGSGPPLDYSVLSGGSKVHRN